MKFKVGDIVPCRDGREVEILKTNAPGRKPIIGMYLDDGSATKRYADGRYDDECTGPYDFIPPKRTREVTVWVNVYEDNCSSYPFEDAARYNAASHALAVAVPCTFTLEY